MGIELGTPLIRQRKTVKRQHWRNRRSEGEDRERKARKEDRKTTKVKHSYMKAIGRGYKSRGRCER